MGEEVGAPSISLSTTMPNLEGSIRFQRPLPECQEMAPLGRVEAAWLLLTDSMGWCESVSKSLLESVRPRLEPQLGLLQAA